MSLSDIQKPNSQVLYGNWILSTPITAASGTIVSTAADNIFIGSSTGNTSLTGTANIAIGSNSGTALTTGSYNCLLGKGAGQSLTNDQGNVFVGFNCGQNAKGTQNVGFGDAACIGLNGSYNCAFGAGALQRATTFAQGAIAVGEFTLNNAQNVNGSIAIGSYALNSVSTNVTTNDVAIGAYALSNYKGGNAGNNVAIGYSAGSSYNSGEQYNIIIGSGVTGTAGDVNTIRIGNATQTAAYIPAAYNAIASGAALYISAAGQIGTLASVARYKDNVKLLQNSSKIHGLVPIEYDMDGIHQYGMLAEHTKKVMPEICHEVDGELRGIKYHELIPYLLKEVQDMKKEIDAMLSTEFDYDSEESAKEMFKLYHEARERENIKIEEKKAEEEYARLSIDEKSVLETQKYKERQIARYPKGLLSPSDELRL